MDARQTLEEAARAARRLPAVAAELGAMDEAWRRGEWLGVGRSWCGHSDPTATSASWRMGRAESLGNERAELERIVEEARALVIGVGELLGAGYSDVLRYRYLESKPWAEAAALMGVSERTAYNRARVAFDTMDALGPARVKQAQGMAEA